jgi:hypothetical protein
VAEDLLSEDKERTSRMRTLQLVRVTKADHDEAGDLGNDSQVKVTPGQARKTGEF